MCRRDAIKDAFDANKCKLNAEMISSTPLAREEEQTYTDIIAS